MNFARVALSTVHLPIRFPKCRGIPGNIIWEGGGRGGGGGLSSRVRNSFIRSDRSIQMIDCEQFAQIAQDK